MAHGGAFATPPQSSLAWRCFLFPLIEPDGRVSGNGSRRKVTRSPTESCASAGRGQTCHAWRLPEIAPAVFQLRWNSRPDTGRRKSAFVARAVRVRFDHAVEKQFLKPENRALVLAQDRPADLLPALEEWRPTHIEKWLSRDARSIGQSARCSQRRGGKLSTPSALGKVRRGRATGNGTCVQFFGIAE